MSPVFAFTAAGLLAICSPIGPPAGLIMPSSIQAERQFSERRRNCLSLEHYARDGGDLKRSLLYLPFPIIFLFELDVIIIIFFHLSVDYLEIIYFTTMSNQIQH